MDGESTDQLLIDEVFCQSGLPVPIVADRGAPRVSGGSLSSKCSAQN